MISTINGKTPVVAPDAWVAPGAMVLGEVELGPRASVWYGAVLRADLTYIRVGARTNIQDGAILHVEAGLEGANIGDDVIVGHRALIHAAQVEQWALIGMGAILLNGCSVREGAVVGAGALVPPGKEIPPYHLALGSPAQVVRKLEPREIEHNRQGVARYLNVVECHRDPTYREDFSKG
jgi:carbonic anhydrase/acetyltransferase-like protein (isoleucine patch superfamily)